MSYILKPKYCPNCGGEIDNIIGIIDTHGKAGKKLMAISDSNFTHGFDCYCKQCDWSGKIYPDENWIVEDD